MSHRGSCGLGYLFLIVVSGGLYDLLHSKKGFKAFKEFLTLEFSVENLLVGEIFR